MAVWTQVLEWDAQGKPYYRETGGPNAGARSYVPPADAQALINNPSTSPADRARLQQWAQAMQRPGTGVFRNAGRWNSATGQWDRGLNWANILSMGAGGLMAGPAIAGAVGGGGVGGGGTLAGAGAAMPTAVPLTSEFMATAMPGSMATVNAAGVGLGGAGMGALGAASRAGSAAGSGGAGASQVAGAGAGGVGDIIRTLAKVGLPIGALLGARALRPDGTGGSAEGGSSISPELQQLLAMSMRRMAAQEPLFEAVNRQAFAGLPAYVKEGR